MKTIFAMLAAMGTLAGPALAGLPQPEIVYYGQALDCYGWPYRSGATVILRKGTNEIARHVVEGSLAPGVNFALHAPFDDGRSTTNLYHRSAVRSGDVVQIAVQDAFGQKTIMESNSVPAVSNPGDLVLVNVTAGTDSDGDGLPDEWERELLLYSLNPLLQTLEDLNGGDDFDGDGMSNRDEYRAGTIAFLDYDYFFIERMHCADGSAQLEFLSVPGKVYRLWSSPLAPPFQWSPAAYATAPGGGQGTGPVEGTGGWQLLHVLLNTNQCVYRMTVE